MKKYPNRHPHEIPVLLTSSVVAHDTEVRLLDTQERIRLALESVGKWLEMNPQQPLVLCDGSNYDFTADVKSLFPDACIECLHFENNQSLVRLHGRGYGEGEIVSFAIKNSKMIADAACFAKCSSKLWVENFTTCVEGWHGPILLQGIFLNALTPWRKTILSYVDTRFYITELKYYTSLFKDAHKRIKKEEGHGLENAFLDIVIENEIKKVFSVTAPVICGVGGGIGKYYKNTRERRLKEYLRLLIVRKNFFFKDLFSKKIKIEND
ncbi:hypothetical protein KIK84_15795 [Curvibacter sp. CHRR-16]|uniref:hypothetical protein n=1 Tax=Curvibacter sp. CHRR-16 TaxID=2835872 RepID=UPI001BDB5FFC|nr:hypothetical protein [Curvibacter sp. CHRR-16]MBT0571780.1 hypothetical protein [Curvibacter sp. CHRR-16]